MNTRERLETALDGGTPDRTPLSIYSWMMGEPVSDEWRRLIDRGLGPCGHCIPYRMIEHGVEDRTEEFVEGGKTKRYHYRKTPAGEIRAGWTDDWHTEYYIKEPADYKVMQWIVEHTEIAPAYEEYDKAAAEIGDDGIVATCISRTPAMLINVDWAGTEQFCIDVAMEVDELMDLYHARMKLFQREAEVLADSPGRFIKSFENLTISMVGPDRYRELLVSAYERAFPIMRKAGKRVFVHYDGALKVIADQIGPAPFDGIESLTEPPEGDMTYDECRAAWPDKTFWANINVDLYYRPPAELKQAVIDKRQRAGKQALAFEISEDLPSNWAESIPVVLEALEELG